MAADRFCREMCTSRSAASAKWRPCLAACPVPWGNAIGVAVLAVMFDIFHGALDWFRRMRDFASMSDIAQTFQEATFYRVVSQSSGDGAGVSLSIRRCLTTGYLGWMRMGRFLALRKSFRAIRTPY
jgi:hypothetical protein